MNKIDIIIPAYNAHKWLGNLLKCLDRQSNKSIFQVALVDDGSVETYDSLINNLNIDLKIRIIRSNRNKGLIEARKLGIKCTENKYIMFLDADDLIASTTLLKEMYDKMENGYNIVFARELNHYKKIYHYFHITGKLFRRNIIENYKIKSHKYTMEEDVSFMMSYYSVISKYSICKIDKLFYKYNTINENSITSKYVKFDNYDYKTMFSAINWAYKYAKKYNNYWFFKDFMFKIFLFIAFEYKNTGIHSQNNNTVYKFLVQSKRFYEKYKIYIENFINFNKVAKNELELYRWFKKVLYNV